MVLILKFQEIVFKIKLEEFKYSQFLTLNTQVVSLETDQEYDRQISALNYKFPRCFKDFKTRESQYNLLDISFAADINGVNCDLQFELIELQGDRGLNGRYECAKLTKLYT
ncbi:unnamed protein product [Schistosoma margrebowiei]|uniref:Uncharacterized protein n=1 Tax=Schistosoma margrebowiei TaxID=48269 RepID=A0AA85ACJ0_9TREM|nr:unnamed protein product [Schistosoma margrebowiei]